MSKLLFVPEYDKTLMKYCGLNSSLSSLLSHGETLSDREEADQSWGTEKTDPGSVRLSADQHLHIHRVLELTLVLWFRPE